MSNKISELWGFYDAPFGGKTSDTSPAQEVGNSEPVQDDVINLETHTGTVTVTAVEDGEELYDLGDINLVYNDGTNDTGRVVSSANNISYNGIQWDTINSSPPKLKNKTLLMFLSAR